MSAMVQESTPRRRIGSAVSREGEEAFVGRCLSILRDGEVDAELIEVLGGNSAGPVLTGRSDGPHGYWVRTWALRAFLYAWTAAAEPTVVAATDDPHWRVREMAAKVLSARASSRCGAEAALERLRQDGHPRVRAAAGRALGRPG
ncbi:HEAT repeat domain-containing protein [Brachybacterium sp. MASK1Z-5]|uniref:HEAT repeat domain-containing protein n=1 Tax=Brachybacterium halotolerans TaxID=2795215 RepID=A0ABS1B8M7_9MICO|nr:HEAT repeat domain-containing protein [Brachybacterium halotolerans]MBK0330995.1 HEAT repeat domain-containing protein [Brachybacterium halotolerans]